MNFWRKLLMIAACTAMCLPLQVFESCCCAKTGRINGTAADGCCAGTYCSAAVHSAFTLTSQESAEREAESTTVPVSKPAMDAFCGAASGCCGVKSANEIADEKNFENLGEKQCNEVRYDLCGLDCRCSCSSLSAPPSAATTVKAIDWSFDWMGVAASIEVLPRASEIYCVAKADDRPPIAHNRRQSILCVWQN